MPKMIVGRKIEYLEAYEIDTDIILSVRDDLDLCQRLLWAAEPALTQRIRSGMGKPGIRLLSRIQSRIVENPIFPVPSIPEGTDECVPVKRGE